MHYLTKREFQEVQAYHGFNPRELTQLELVVKQVVEVSKTPAVTDIHRRDKKIAMNEVIKNLQMVTDNASIIEVARNGLEDPEQLPALLSKFPYVEFEKVINQGKVNKFQEAFGSGCDYTTLKTSAEWLNVLCGIVAELPLGNNCFVTTPDTCRLSLRKHCKTNPGTYTRPLQPDKQAILDGLFSDTFKTQIKTVLQFGLYGEIPELKRRLKLDLTTGISVEDKHYPFYIEYVKEPYMEFLQFTICDLSSTGAIRETCYKFVVPQFNI